MELGAPGSKVNEFNTTLEVNDVSRHHHVPSESHMDGNIPSISRISELKVDTPSNTWFVFTTRDLLDINFLVPLPNPTMPRSSGFRSRWITPRLCMWAKPSKTWAEMQQGKTWVMPSTLTFKPSSIVPGPETLHTHIKNRNHKVPKVIHQSISMK